MADETPGTPVAPAPQAEPNEGFLHSLATSVGIDPEAVKSAAKAIWANPVEAAKTVGGAQVDEFVDAAKHPIKTARLALNGVISSITNPEAQAAAKARFNEPGFINKLQGAEEYVTSGLPTVGGGLVKSEEQAGAGNIPGSMGTLTGVVAPILTGAAEAGAEALPEKIHAAGEQARANMAARQEARVAEAKTGKVITLEPQKALPEAPKQLGPAPDMFAEAGGKLVGPRALAEAPAVVDPIENLITSDKIGGKKVRGATPKAVVDSFPEEEGDLEELQMRAFDHPQMKNPRPGKDTIDAIQQRPTLLLKDGSTLHGRGMAHFEIAENLGGRNLLSTHAVRIAGPSGYEFFGRPSEEQMAQIAKWHNQNSLQTGDNTLAWDFHSTDTGKKTPLQVLGGTPEKSGEGSIGDLQRAIDQYYPSPATKAPEPEKFASVGGKFVGKMPEPATQNAAAGFIRNDGSFHELQYGSHPDDAHEMGETVSSLLKDGWVRKAGQGSYETAKLNPQTTAAIEKDILADYHDLKHGNEYGQPVDSIVVSIGKKDFEIPVDDFIDKYNGDLTKAMRVNKIASAAPAAPYHPDLQKVVDKYGTHADPSKAAIPGRATFVAPDGKFITLPAGVDHPDAIIAAGAKHESTGLVQDAFTVPPFLNDTETIRIRPTLDKGGPTLHVSVPKDGVTPEQVDALKQAVGQGLGRNGNMMLETADNPRDIKTAYKEFVSPTHVDDMLKEIGAHPEQPKDFVTGEQQSALKEPYSIEITDLNGTQHTEAIEAHSPKKAMAEAQKKFPNAVQWSIEHFEARTPSTEYSVPKGKLAKMPASMGRPEVDTVRHELGHALVGQNEGLTVKGMISASHPDAGEDMRAGVQWNGADLYERGPKGLQIRADKRAAVLKNMMGGIAADEAFNDIPRAANHNFSVLSGGDGTQAYNILKAAGFTDREAFEQMHKYIDEAKEYLTHPAVSGIISENENFRESGLSRHFHYSPERLQNMHAEVQRRINAATQEQPAAKPDDRTVGGATAEAGGANVARGEGGISQTTAAVSPEKGIVTAEIRKPEDYPAVYKRIEETATPLDEVKSSGYVFKPENMQARGQAGVILPDGAVADIGDATEHDPFFQELGIEDYRAFLKDTKAARYDLTGDFGNEEYHHLAAEFFDKPSRAQLEATAAIARHSGVGQVTIEWPGFSKEIQFPTPAKIMALGAEPDLTIAEKTKKTAPEVAPNTKLQASAQKYVAAHDMPEINHEPVKADPERATEIAKIYDEAKHDPSDPRVKAAYDALKSETLAQFHHLRDDLGLKFKPQAEDPYKSAGEMMDDIKKNNQLKVYSTADELPKDHPLSEVAPGTGGQTYNTVFRWVHDAMGHAAGGNDFSENGEKSATEAHAQMYSDTARPAMRAETEGQTSWFFHNPKVVAGEAHPGEFAPQKATILPDVSADWHKAAGKMAATDEAGGINPRTGKSDTKGFGTEILPELRQPLDHAPTAEDFKKFYTKHQDIFDQHPELRVGWDNQSAVKGGHEINIGAVGPNAAKVAANLDQKSAFDIAKGEVIPTGGTGLQTKFPNYPLEQRIKDLNESNHTVSTRVPTKTVKGETVEDHTDQSRMSDLEAAKSAPGYMQKMVNRTNETPGFTAPDATAQEQADAYIRHAADNIKFVAGKVTPEEFKRDEQWYPVGAHNRGIEVAKQHGVTPHQVYAVTAVESPMTDWDQNTSLAERTVNIWKNQQNTKFTPAMQKAADKITSLPANKAFKPFYKKLEGKTLAELPTTTLQAHWLRLYDEAHNPREYEKWGPDGKSLGLATNTDGSNASVGWSFQRHIEKAIDILKDGSDENISKQLGYGHKVRNFYNNQLAPDDPRFLTMDTHAINVAQLRPMSGKTKAVRENFGTIKNGAYGLKGTYPVHDAAYRLAAKELDIPIPGRLQSPTWVKIREVFTDDFETPENQAAVDAIWKEHEDGKITADQARNNIWDYATRWNRENASRIGAASNQGQLFETGVRGESPTGAAGRGTGSGTPGEISASGVDEGDTSFEFGANVKPVVARSRVSKVSAAQKAKNDAMIRGLASLTRPGKK